MEILFWVLVIYVTLDIAACAYVVYQRGGIKATVSEIHDNLGFTRPSEDDDDVYDQR
jgi:hypothetical protein